LSGVLNQSGGGAKFELTPMSDPGTALQDVDDHVVDGAILVQREPSGRLSTTVQLGETMGNDSLTNLTVGMFGVAILDFMSQNPQGGFELPTTNIVRALGGGGGTAEPSAYASRLIVGMLFGVLIFITIVIYGMWVAAGVVAEKSSRVMELLISAASPRQLVLGKAIGIGLAGATQYVLVLVPAVLVLIVEDRIADAVLGPSGGISLSLGALSPALFLAFGVFYALGFALYSLVYAAAGSLVSRPEDLQIIALPLSIVAIAGYLQAILALTGGITWFIRIASFVPFWSPFVMLTRLSIGRVSPLELVVSVALLVVTIVVVGIVAIRIYGAGVLLYGQRPGFRAYVEAARRG
jgi:ABC-2 type transport system permease protein